MLTERDYLGAGDLRSMIELLLQVRPAERVSDWPGVVELQEVMQRPAVTANTRLWQDERRLIAWAFVDEWSNLHFLGRPPSEEWATAVVWWACEVAGARARAGETGALNASAPESDGERIALLIRHGFVQQRERTLHYARSLRDPLPSPDLPPGFHIRPLGPGEVEAAAELHRLAFETEYMTVENRRAIMTGEEYDPSGDLVAVAPDGRLAGYTLASISAVENYASGRMDGFTDPVATRPEFQRMGLAKALLLAGCTHLKARGATRARLGTSSENIVMQRAAESAGYRLESAMLWFSRALKWRTGR